MLDFFQRAAYNIPLVQYRHQRATRSPSGTANTKGASRFYIGFWKHCILPHFVVFCRRKMLSASTAVMLPPSRHIVPCPEEVQFFVILLTVSNVHTHEIPKGGIPSWIFWILFFPHWTFWLQSSSVSSMWHGWSRGMSFGTNLGQSTILKNDKKNDRPTVYQTQAVIYS